MADGSHGADGDRKAGDTPLGLLGELRGRGVLVVPAAGGRDIWIFPPGILEPGDAARLGRARGDLAALFGRLEGWRPATDGNGHDPERDHALLERACLSIRAGLDRCRHCGEAGEIARLDGTWECHACHDTLAAALSPAARALGADAPPTGEYGGSGAGAPAPGAARDGKGRDPSAGEASARTTGEGANTGDTQEDRPGDTPKGTPGGAKKPAGPPRRTGRPAGEIPL